jgi:hypothetical protein
MSSSKECPYYCSSCVEKTQCSSCSYCIVKEAVLIEYLSKYDKWCNDPIDYIELDRYLKKVAQSSYSKNDPK